MRMPSWLSIFLSKDMYELYAVIQNWLLALYEHFINESTKVQTLGVFLGIDRSMSWKQRCYVSVSYVSM